MNMSESKLEEIQPTQSDINQLATPTTKNLLPTLSRQRYDIAYNNFMKWKSKNNDKSFSEDVLVAYFVQLKQKYQSNTLWSLYSMLRSSLIVKHDTNIATYLKLRAVLKTHSDGYQPKKSNTLTPEDVKKFIETAPDEIYLLTKVALIFGISGALRKTELYSIKLTHLKDLNSALLVNVPVIKTKTFRSFTITENFYDLYKKYASLRPTRLTDPNERFFINYHKGKCTSQFVGINKFGKMVQDIAKFLKLPNPRSYTGHSFRRCSATVLVDSSGYLLTLKQHSGWKSSTAIESNQQKVLLKSAPENRDNVYGEIPSTYSEEPHGYNLSAYNNEQKSNVEDLEIKKNIQFSDADANFYQHEYTQQPMKEIAGPSTQYSLENKIVVSSIKNEPLDSEVRVSCKQESLESESEVVIPFIKLEPSLILSERVIDADVDILIDGEKNFLLSLLPHVCSLTDEEKVHFQTKTLQLLDDIANLRISH